MMKHKRNAGVLLHITSLPSNYGIGTLGQEAFDFIDWMQEAKLNIWQVLPLVPTSYGDSPYQSVSSSALNYYLIDFDILNKKGLLPKSLYETFECGNDPLRVNYNELFEKKVKVLKLAFQNFDKKNNDFIRFIEKGEAKDFALFMTIKERHNHNAWELWEDKYRNYSLEIENEVLNQYQEEYLFWIWTQFEFLEEWKELKNYANAHQIEIMGDMPLYIAFDSVEVWKNPELFILNKDKSRKLVAGCPPDAFSDDGQLWGNPVYDWDYMKETKYAWWNERIETAFQLFDILRIDHFRGFDRFYAVKADAETARIGEWLDGPKIELFKDKLEYKIVAEDLGVIDEGVIQLMKDTGYPGMKILEFAFDGQKDNEHKPSNYKENFIVYTGTHDNMPLKQYILDLNENEIKVYLKDLITECTLLNVDYNFDTVDDIIATVITLAMASKARCAIIPMQDFLCQDGKSRMNLPSTVSTDNWSYRVLKTDISSELAANIKEMINKFRR